MKLKIDSCLNEKLYLDKFLSILINVKVVLTIDAADVLTIIRFSIE